MGEGAVPRKGPVGNGKQEYELRLQVSTANHQQEERGLRCSSWRGWKHRIHSVEHRQGMSVDSLGISVVLCLFHMISPLFKFKIARE